jgi:Mg-chelatase subunit ChlD
MLDLAPILRRFALLAGVAALATALVTPPARAQSIGGGGGATKENLDLPFDALGEEEEEEEAPEVVTFYGTQLEGDGIFYCIDRSGSMQDSGELAIAKRELAKNIQEFSDRVQFGIVFFDRGINKFPQSGMPAEANAGMKSSAMSFVQAIPGGSGSCCQAGMAAALQMASMASSKRKVLVYLGDGGGTCQGADESTYLRATLSAITAQNFQRITINCIGILNPPTLNEDFLKKLAAANSGTYTRKNS